MARIAPRSPAAALVRWTARGWSLLSVLFVLTFLVGELLGGSSGPSPTAAEWVAIALWPGTVLVGLVLAWWRERAGGILALAGLALFYGWMLLLRGSFPGGPFFALLTAPALLFLLADRLGRRR